MPKKNTLKSRKNKRQFSLKKATKKRGGGIFNVFGRSRRSKPKQDDLIPPVPKLETFNDLHNLFHGNIPLDIFTIDMDKIQQYKNQEYKRLEENHLQNIKRQEEMHKIAEKMMKDNNKRQDEDMLFRPETTEWEPIREPPPLQPRSNTEEPPLPPRYNTEEPATDKNI